MLNLMVDPLAVCSEIPHPSFPLRKKSRDLKRRVNFYSRTLRPAKYYIIDFDMASRYAPDIVAPMETPMTGGDKTVPEFQNAKRDDLFNTYHTDIYYLGSTIRMIFMQVRLHTDAVACRQLIPS